MNSLFIGNIIYEIWNAIVVLILCSVVLFFVGNPFQDKKWEVLIANLLYPVVAILIQLQFYNSKYKLYFALLYIVVFVFWKSRKHGSLDWFGLLFITLCSLLGFGWNVAPLSIAFLFFVVVKLGNKKVGVR